MSTSTNTTQSIPYGRRAALPGGNPLGSYLLHLMAVKKTNLCVSADVNSTSHLLRLAEEVGDSICILKTHADIVDDFGERTIKGLREISRRKKFLIFEDRKFGDIGSTVQQQYTRGPLQISAWAHLVNAHVFPGPAIITALQSAAESTIDHLVSNVSTSISAGTPRPSSDYDEDDRPPPGFESDFYVSDSRKNSIAEAIESPPPSNTDDLKTPSATSFFSSRSPGNGSSPGSASTSPAASATANFHIPLANRRPDDHGRKGSVVTATTTISQVIEPDERIPGISRSSSAEEAFRELSEPPLARGLLLLAEMSSEKNLFTREYTDACVEMARSHKDFVVGFISQRNLNSSAGRGLGSDRDNFLSCTPGVGLPPSTSESDGAVNGSERARPGSKGMLKGDGLGQQYRTPDVVIGADGSDIIIVGRGITQAKDRRKEAERFRAEGWSAYEKRLKGS
ncbi:orotidine 5'-phosphate decarboxylase [Agyrium rufum]|nr:orotidine 5'-phosphate decarboxylase [Agyrium rufum]